MGLLRHSAINADLAFVDQRRQPRADSSWDMPNRHKKVVVDADGVGVVLVIWLSFQMDGVAGIHGSIVVLHPDDGRLDFTQELFGVGLGGFATWHGDVLKDVVVSGFTSYALRWYS